jgi:CheY-like chemotaxis protein
LRIFRELLVPSHFCTQSPAERNNKISSLQENYSPDAGHGQPAFSLDASPSERAAADQPEHRVSYAPQQVVCSDEHKSQTNKSSNFDIDNELECTHEDAEASSSSPRSAHERTVPAATALGVMWQQFVEVFKVQNKALIEHMTAPESRDKHAVFPHGSLQNWLRRILTFSRTSRVCQALLLMHLLMHLAIVLLLSLHWPFLRMSQEVYSHLVHGAPLQLSWMSVDGLRTGTYVAINSVLAIASLVLYLLESNRWWEASAVNPAVAQWTQEHMRERIKAILHPYMAMNGRSRVFVAFCVCCHAILLAAAVESALYYRSPVPGAGVRSPFSVGLLTESSLFLSGVSGLVYAGILPHLVYSSVYYVLSTTATVMLLQRCDLYYVLPPGFYMHPSLSPLLLFPLPFASEAFPKELLLVDRTCLGTSRRWRRSEVGDVLWTWTVGFPFAASFAAASSASANPPRSSSSLSEFTSGQTSFGDAVRVLLIFLLALLAIAIYGGERIVGSEKEAACIVGAEEQMEQTRRQHGTELALLERLMQTNAGEVLDDMLRKIMGPIRESVHSIAQLAHDMMHRHKQRARGDRMPLLPRRTPSLPRRLPAAAGTDRGMRSIDSALGRSPPIPAASPAASPAAAPVAVETSVEDRWSPMGGRRLQVHTDSSSILCVSSGSTAEEPSLTPRSVGGDDRSVRDHFSLGRPGPQGRQPAAESGGTSAEVSPPEPERPERHGDIERPAAEIDFHARIQPAILSTPATAGTSAWTSDNSDKHSTERSGATAAHGSVPSDATPLTAVSAAATAGSSTVSIASPHVMRRGGEISFSGIGNTDGQDALGAGAAPPATAVGAAYGLAHTTEMSAPSPITIFSVATSSGDSIPRLHRRRSSRRNHSGSSTAAATAGANSVDMPAVHHDFDARTDADDLSDVLEEVGKIHAVLATWGSAITQAYLRAGMTQAAMRARSLAAVSVARPLRGHGSGDDEGGLGLSFLPTDDSQSDFGSGEAGSQSTEESPREQRCKEISACRGRGAPSFDAREMEQQLTRRSESSRARLGPPGAYRDHSASFQAEDIGSADTQSGGISSFTPTMASRGLHRGQSHSRQQKRKKTEESVEPVGEGGTPSDRAGGRRRSRVDKGQPPHTVLLEETDAAHVPLGIAPEGASQKHYLRPMPASVPLPANPADDESSLQRTLSAQEMVLEGMSVTVERLRTRTPAIESVRQLEPGTPVASGEEELLRIWGRHPRRRLGMSADAAREPSRTGSSSFEASETSEATSTPAVPSGAELSEGSMLTPRRAVQLHARPLIEVAMVESRPYSGSGVETESAEETSPAPGQSAYASPVTGPILPAGSDAAEEEHGSPPSGLKAGDTELLEWSSANRYHLLMPAHRQSPSQAELTPIRFSGADDKGQSSPLAPTSPSPSVCSTCGEPLDAMTESSEQDEAEGAEDADANGKKGITQPSPESFGAAVHSAHVSAASTVALRAADIGDSGQIPLSHAAHAATFGVFSSPFRETWMDGRGSSAPVMRPQRLANEQLSFQPAAAFPSTYVARSPGAATEELSVFAGIAPAYRDFLRGQPLALHPLLSGAAVPHAVQAAAMATSAGALAGAPKVSAMYTLPHHMAFHPVTGLPNTSLLPPSPVPSLRPGSAQIPPPAASLFGRGAVFSVNNDTKNHEDENFEEQMPLPDSYSEAPFSHSFRQSYPSSSGAHNMLVSEPYMTMSGMEPEGFRSPTELVSDLIDDSDLDYGHIRQYVLKRQQYPPPPIVAPLAAAASSLASAIVNDPSAVASGKMTDATAVLLGVASQAQAASEGGADARTVNTDEETSATDPNTSRSRTTSGGSALSSAGAVDAAQGVSGASTESAHIHSKHSVRTESGGSKGSADSQAKKVGPRISGNGSEGDDVATPHSVSFYTDPRRGPQGRATRLAAESDEGHGTTPSYRFGLHVLVVDDEKINRKIAGRMLERLGCSFEAIEDGDEVTQALITSELPFDVILLDILMRRSNGLDICRSLREQRIQVPIIAATANYSSAEEGLYRAAGFDRVLTKPFGVKKLAAAMASVLGNRLAKEVYRSTGPYAT